MHVTRSRPPIWLRTGYDLIFRVSQRYPPLPPRPTCAPRSYPHFERDRSEKLGSRDSESSSLLSRVPNKKYIIYMSHREGNGGGTLVYRPFRAGEHARGSAAYGCFRGLYDNAAGWIPRHYNMNPVRLGHVRLTTVHARTYMCSSCVRVVHLRFLPAAVALLLLLFFFTTFPLSRASRTFSFCSSRSSVQFRRTEKRRRLTSLRGFVRVSTGIKARLEKNRRRKSLMKI